MRSAWIVLLFWLASLADVGIVAQQPPQPEAPGRLDDGLVGADGPHAVFVRFREQWLPDASAFAEHCAAHRDGRRREQRRVAVRLLTELAEKSWKRFAPRLAAIDGVEHVQRYWLVNGFACRASGAACRALADDPEVAFVFRKPDGVPDLHARARRGPRVPPGDVDRVLASLEQPDELPALDRLHVPFDLERLRVPEAWRDGALGEGVVVAMLDSGLLDTPALTAALWHNPGEALDGEDGDGNGLVDDVFGYDFAAGAGSTLGDSGRCHGSMCAGIVAGRPVEVDGELLCTGVAPKARLMVLRGMGRLLAYEYALREGADVLSMSYMYVGIDLGNWRAIYRQAHEHLTAAGIVSVGGSGNFQQREPVGKQICLPKDIPCVIAASGLDHEDRLPPFSSLGPCRWDDVVFYRDHGADAPLVKPDVTTYSMDFPVWSRLSQWPVGRRGVRHVHDAGGGVGLIVGARGNSFAGPHVAGVVALMLSVDPDLPAWRVKELLEASCRDLGDEGKDTRFGAGLVDAQRAVAAVRSAR